MVSFENFVKSMPPSLSELKVTPSFCFPFKIPDDPTPTNSYVYHNASLAILIHKYIPLGPHNIHLHNQEDIHIRYKGYLAFEKKGLKESDSMYDKSSKPF